MYVTSFFLNYLWINVRIKLNILFCFLLSCMVFINSVQKSWEFNTF